MKIGQQLINLMLQIFNLQTSIKLQKINNRLKFMIGKNLCYDSFITAYF